MDGSGTFIFQKVQVIGVEVGSVWPEIEANINECKIWGQLNNPLDRLSDGQTLLDRRRMTLNVFVPKEHGI